MRCARARQLLHLNREGELRESLRSAVLRHADRCPECASELARITNTQKVFDSLRNAEPALGNPRELTTAIMHRVLSRDERARWPAVSFTVFMWIRLQRAVQFACILLVAAFFLQSILDARRMAALDERLVQVRPPLRGGRSCHRNRSPKRKRCFMHFQRASARLVVTSGSVHWNRQLLWTASGKIPCALHRNGG